MSDVEATGGEAGGSDSAAEFLQSIGNELGSARQDAAAARQEAARAGEIASRLKQAFAPEPQAPNELAWYDDVLDAFIEAEKAGKPMPLTGKLATVLAENQKRTIELEKLVRKQSEVIEKLQNPASAANQRAFAAMDDAITTTLEGMYGEVPVAFHDAVSSEVESVIRTLMKEAPEKWEQIRRSEQFQKRLVAHCAQKLVPPKARQVMLEKHETERPTTAQDFTQAIQELEQLKALAAQGRSPYSPAQLKQMETELRQKAWEFKYNGSQRYNQPGRRR